jgi:hypothetical protein
MMANEDTSISHKLDTLRGSNEQQINELMFSLGLSTTEQ